MLLLFQVQLSATMVLLLVVDYFSAFSTATDGVSRGCCCAVAVAVAVGVAAATAAAVVVAAVVRI